MKPTSAGPRGVFFFLSATLLLASPAFAQEAWHLDFFRPHFSLYGSAVSNADTKDVPGEYGVRAGGASLVVPLVESDLTAKSGSRFQLLGDLRYRYAATDVGFLGGRRNLSSSGVGLAALFLPGGKESFVASLGIGLAEDADTIGSPRGRVGGLLLGVHRSSETLSLSYGLGYSYVFGRGRGLPVAGITWRPDDRWRVAALLPFTASVRYRQGPSWAFGVRVGADGNLYRVANGGSFPGQPDALNLRMTGFRAGASASLHAGGGVTLRLEGGWMALRKLGVYDGSTEVFTTKVKDAPYALLALDVGFGRGRAAPERLSIADEP